MPWLWTDLAVVSTVFLTTMLLYAPSLAYPFVWYDSDDLLRAIKHSTADLFSGVAGYQYYRPLIFTFWKLILNTWGSASAPMFHAYLIGAHILNGVLLYALAVALTRSRGIAAAAALLFVAYPFSYQAVTWTIAHQPPSLTFVLASLLIYTRVRLDTQKVKEGRAAPSLHRWSPVTRHILALLCLIAAMLLHESAFVGAGILLLIEAFLVISRRIARASIWPLAYLAVTLIVFVAYSAAAKSSPAVETFQILTAEYLLQGLIYPAAMVVARACLLLSCDGVAWLGPVGALTLAGLAILWRWNHRILIGVLGMLWFGLGVAPVWAGRDTVYVEYAPRLLYLASAGAALSLAVIFGNDTKGRRRAAQVGIIAVILVQSAQFVMARQSLHEYAFRLLEQENRAMFAPRQEAALFVNTVELFDFKEREFPMGWFGVLVSPWHNQLVETLNLRADHADWVIDPAQAATTSSRSRLALEYHGRIVSPEQFREALAGVSDVYRVEAPTPDDGNLHLFKVAEIDHGSDLPETYITEWLRSVRLVSASVETEAGIPVLNLQWAIAGMIDPNQTVFVHMRDASGRIVAQADGDLIGGMAPLGDWPAGSTIRERRPLIVPRDLQAGRYTVAVGLYNRATLERIAPTESNQQITDGALIVGPFDIP